MALPERVAIGKHRLAEVNTSDPDAGQLSRSAELQLAPFDQPFNPEESNPPLVAALVASGTLHLHTLFVQLKVPDWQSETVLHCLQELTTQIGDDDDEQVPHV